MTARFKLGPEGEGEGLGEVRALEAKGGLDDFAVDGSPKQGRFLPGTGTRLPIDEPARIDEERPDHLLILPRNLEFEIRTDLSRIRSWSGDFIAPIPQARTID